MPKKVSPGSDGFEVLPGSENSGVCRERRRVADRSDQAFGLQPVDDVVHEFLS